MSKKGENYRGGKDAILKKTRKITPIFLFIPTIKKKKE